MSEDVTEAQAADEATPDARRAPSRFGTVWLAMAVVVGLLLGYAAGLLTPSLRAPGDTSAEAGFARDMSVHHGQAIEIAMLMYRKTQRDDVRDMAYEIALTQKGQIGTMSRWLEEWRLNPTGGQPRMAWMPDGQTALENGRMPGMATDAEIQQLSQATGDQADILFCQLMTRHHLGGIHMVDGVLELSDRPEVVSLATAMKTGQQKELNAMRQILTDLGIKPQ